MNKEKTVTFDLTIDFSEIFNKPDDKSDWCPSCGKWVHAIKVETKLDGVPKSTVIQCGCGKVIAIEYVENLHSINRKEDTN